MPSDNRRIMMVVTALVAVGATLRLQMYLFDKPLWWPEAALALNILRRSGWALLGPYDFHQAAPIGFVLITKAGTLLFGDSERVLRLPAFLFGLASLPLFYVAARAYISQAAALLALAFFALSPSAIYWASNCKQYSSDLTFAIAALMLGSWLVRNPLTPRRALAGGLFGAVGLFFSFPLVFLLTGLAAGLACDYLVRRDRQALFRLVPVCAAWGVVFALTYHVSLRTIDVDGFLKVFWAQRFLSVSDWHHSYALVASAFIVPLDLATVHPWPLMPVCALGLWAIFARRQALGLFLAVPVLALAIASLFHMYPFWHRMILFVLPLLLLPTCEGVVVIVERARWMWKPLGAVVAVALVALLGVRTVEHLIVAPKPFLEIRPMLRHVREHTRPGDVMYIGEFQPPYEYYKDRLGLAAQPYVVGRYLDKEWAGSDDQVLESLRDSPRVWVLTGDWQVQAGLERFATLVEIMPNEDLTLSLYDPQAQPRTLPPGATVSSGR